MATYTPDSFSHRYFLKYSHAGQDNVNGAVVLAASRNNNPYVGGYCLVRELPFNDSPLILIFDSEDIK